MRRRVRGPFPTLGARRAPRKALALSPGSVCGNSCCSCRRHLGGGSTPPSRRCPIRVGGLRKRRRRAAAVQGAARWCTDSHADFRADPLGHLARRGDRWYWGSEARRLTSGRHPGRFSNAISDRQEFDEDLLTRNADPSPQKNGAPSNDMPLPFWNQRVGGQCRSSLWVGRKGPSALRMTDCRVVAMKERFSSTAAR
jgi:hypothetical protein